MALAVLAVSVLTWVRPASSATAVPNRIDLRVLVLDSDTPWTRGLETQMDLEGIPYTAIPVSGSRPTIDAAFLADGNEAKFQAVIVPEATYAGLSTDEIAALQAYEAKFGIREIVANHWANPTIGLNYAGYVGDFTGKTATVTAAGKANGFGYLNGPVVFGVGSYVFLAQPLTTTSVPPLPAGASFTTLLSAPIPGTTPATDGSLIGVYTVGGVERMMITSTFGSALTQFQALAHGVLSWATRGVHLGYNRNYFTMHADDAFSEDALWDAEHNCTPGEDCPRNADGTSIYPESSIRMTPADVTYAAQWSAANSYQLTLAFNASYASAADALTQMFQAQKTAFRWLNHGFEHIYQGCVQDFSATAWQCSADANGTVWTPQATIAAEIQNNIAAGQQLGLPFDASEYLSGEHSGLAQLPQQPVDNPNFAAAIAAAGVKVIGADASRPGEQHQRTVGGALTIPRHPTAIYYNAGTVAAEIDEYNYLYNTVGNGGSGYCESNPATATCLSAPLGADGFTNYIVPTDAAYDLHFILANDPRPFYAHVSNLAGDRILYPLLEKILGTYRAAFAPNAPVVNLTETQAATVLGRQEGWANTGMAGSSPVSAHLQNGQVTITNSGTGPVPVTVPAGSTVAGVSLESYGGELSGWLPAKPTTTVALPPTTIMVTGSTTFAIGTANAINIAADGSPAPTITLDGALPAGVVFSDNANGTASITGTAGDGTTGSYPVTITATSGSARLTEALALNVGIPVVITSANSTTASNGAAFNFAVTATGSPLPTITASGALPAGVTFVAAADGTATIAGTPTANGSFPLTITATNATSTATQAFTLAVGQGPAFTSANATTVKAGTAMSFKVTTTGFPTAAITRTGNLPAGVTFTAAADGTATLGGTPTVSGTFPLTFTATNSRGTATQAFALTTTANVAFTSVASTTLDYATILVFQVKATGTPVPAITMTGSLPLGVFFVPGSNGTATLAGIPLVAGSYPVTFKATNSTGTVTQSFTLVVQQDPRITSSSSASGRRGTTFSFTVSSTGSPIPTLARTAGTLPPGLSLVANTNGTATIKGTPTAAGTYTVTITATSAAGTAQQSLRITIL